MEETSREAVRAAEPQLLSTAGSGSALFTRSRTHTQIQHIQALTEVATRTIRLLCCFSGTRFFKNRRLISHYLEGVNLNHWGRDRHPLIYWLLVGTCSVLNYYYSKLKSLNQHPNQQVHPISFYSYLFIYFFALLQKDREGEIHIHNCTVLYCIAGLNVLIFSPISVFSQNTSA